MTESRDGIEMIINPDKNENHFGVQLSFTLIVRSRNKWDNNDRDRKDIRRRDACSLRSLLFPIFTARQDVGDKMRISKNNNNVRRFGVYNSIFEPNRTHNWKYSNQRKRNSYRFPVPPDLFLQLNKMWYNLFYEPII